MLIDVKFDEEQFIPQRPVLSKLGNDLYWQYMEIKNPIIEELTLSKRLKFKHGNIIENQIIDYLKEGGIRILANQASVSTGIECNGRKITGKIDGMVRVGESKLLLEIKTMNHGQFHRTQESGLMEVNYTYYVQCQMYMHYMKLEACLMLLYNKNNSDLSEDFVAYDKEFSLYNEKRLKKLVWHLDNDVIPDFEYPYDDPKNQYNPYLEDYPQPDKQLIIN
jgi:Holliday junction resolvase-like predicted endonuclease